MRFTVLLIAAVFGDFALASFNVRLFKSTDCKNFESQGHLCSRINKDSCCSKKNGDSFELFGSASFEEDGSKDNTDKLNFYEASGKDACHQNIHTVKAGNCADHEEKKGAGAMVKIVITGAEARRARREAPAPVMMVEPDSVFYINANGTEWIMDITSTLGQQYENISSQAEQIQFIMANGKISA
ncbi:hypothetical protein EG329_000699 [Mollisiaceae sp. DMI_Dod_QoI]|nr:hypothetical protein EG329_000699 [Helotiales sp. DMI_Dod_QoI]